MVVVKPFKAIRPEKNLAEKVATLPYDVINSKEAREMAADNPYTYLHIDKSEIDLPENISPYDPLVYQQAADTLKSFLQKGWLVKDDTPYFYLYELTMDGRAQTGLVVTTSVADYTNGLIKKHEFTRPEKELDRINHSDVCDANTSPIFLTYRQENHVQRVIEDWKAAHQPVYDFPSFHNVHHRVWLIDNEAVIQELESAFAAYVPALYIADGHHRTESAVKVGQKRLTDQPHAPEDAEFRYFLSVLFPKEELAILDYNRVLNVPLPADFFDQLKNAFTVEEVAKTDRKPAAPKTFAMYTDGKWYRLTAKEAIIPSDAVGRLDVSILQTQVFDKIFGITDVRTDKRIDFVGGIRGLEELERLVDSGSFTIAFALYPTTMDDLLNVADAGEIMPPKSTWFEPKLLSGLFLHDLESR